MMIEVLLLACVNSHAICLALLNQPLTEKEGYVIVINCTVVFIKESEEHNRQKDFGCE